MSSSDLDLKQRERFLFGVLLRWSQPWHTWMTCSLGGAMLGMGIGVSNWVVAVAGGLIVAGRIRHDAMHWTMLRRLALDGLAGVERERDERRKWS